MKTYEGKSVFGGVAIGKVLVYKKGEQQVKRYRVSDTKAEIERFEGAKAEAVEQLKELYAKAVKEVGEASAAIFEIHQMMLEDLDYLDSIHNMIETQEVNAEYAVATTSDNFAMMFSSMDDAYMKERAADVKDVSERILAILSGGAKSTVATDEPSIIVADDLAPSETVQLDKDKVLAFVTVHGSSNSHTAILARTMGIPALIGTPVDLESVDGKMAVVDGYTGTFYVDPDEETMKTMEEKRRKDLEQKELLQNLKGKENITLDGKKINVYANIGNIKDLAMVLQNDAGGIGLFRSEFIYLEKDCLLYTSKEAGTKKKAFKMPHLLWIMLGLLLIASILTYIIPAGQFATDEAGNCLLYTSRRSPKCWAGIALLGSQGMTEEEKTFLEEKETKVPGVTCSQVQMPVWIAVAEKTEDVERELAFYCGADHSGGSRTMEEGGEIWTPQAGGTVDEHWCANVVFDRRNWEDCLGFDCASRIYDTVSAGVYRYPGNGNGALRRNGDIRSRGFQKFSEKVAGGYYEDGRDSYRREWWVYLPESADRTKPVPARCV